MIDYKKKKRKVIALIVMAVIVFIMAITGILGYSYLTGSKKAEMTAKEEATENVEDVEEERTLEFVNLDILAKVINEDMLAEFQELFTSYIVDIEDYDLVSKVTVEKDNIDYTDEEVSFYVTLNNSMKSMYYCSFLTEEEIFSFVAYGQAYNEETAIAKAETDITNQADVKNEITEEERKDMASTTTGEKASEVDVTVNDIEKLEAVLTDNGIEVFKEDLLKYLQEQKDTRRSLTISGEVANNADTVTFVCKYDVVNSLFKTTKINVTLDVENSTFSFLAE
ncbi:MAG: hypothetical protein ACK5LL_05515 [Suipraeoptans sp.]